MAAHAPFAPSAAKRWMTCPGSHLPSQLIPSQDNEYSLEGTRLHDVAAGFLNKTRPDMDKADWYFLQPYLDYALKLGDQCHTWGVEQPVRFNELLYGTADLLAIVERTLHVTDLKTGRGIQVDPEDNPQMLTYAVCFLEEYPAIAQDIDDVVLTIAQPPVDGPVEIRSWVTTVERVREHRAALLEAMDAALKPQAPFVSGEHCRYCPIKAACPELTSLTRSALALPSLVGLSPLDVSRWLDKADLIQTWLDGLRETAHAAVTAGVVIPGYALKPKRATRSWADEEAVATVARAKRLRIFQPRKLMSPAMAEKAHPELPPEIVREIVSISSGTNLVKDPTVTGEDPSKVSKAEALRQFKLRIAQ